MVYRGPRDIFLSCALSTQSPHWTRFQLSARWGEVIEHASSPNAPPDRCSAPAQDPVSAACGHAFCRLCIGEYSAGAVGAAQCPTCAAPLTINFSAPAAVRPTRWASDPFACDVLLHFGRSMVSGIVYRCMTACVVLQLSIHPP